jgi:hypothetical protein
MEIDWIVGVLVFLVFTGWAFTYYFAIFEMNKNHSEIESGLARNAITDYISTGVYEAPVKYNSPSVVSGAVLKAKSLWYNGEKNSTRVFSGGQPLGCRIDGDDIYWQSDLVQGYNVFSISVAAVNGTMNCTGTFGISSYNLTVPWAFEGKNMVSLAKIYNMTNTSYDDFRKLLNIGQNFRVTIEKGSGEMEYGKSIPYGPLDVYSKTSERKIFETSEMANITIAIW